MPYHSLIMPSANAINKPTANSGGKCEELKYLPPGTCEYKYSGNIKDMEKTIQLERGAFLALMDGQSTPVRNPFMGFSCVSQAAVEQHVENNRNIEKLVFSYDKINHILVLRMPSRAHELAASVFGDLVGKKLAKMGLSFLDLHNLLSSWVTTTRRKKAPDMSWQPTELPKGRSHLWPTFVLEVGYTETEAQLERDARW